jgi:hypothetical protein
MLPLRTPFFICLLAAAGLMCACKSKPPPTLSEQYSAQFGPDVGIGNYYKTGGLMTAFYDEPPDLYIGKMPARMLGPFHVVQLLDASAGGKWAKVRNEKDEVGYVKFSKLKIVPFDKQPEKPKHRRENWDD